MSVAIALSSQRVGRAAFALASRHGLDDENGVPTPRGGSVEDGTSAARAGNGGTGRAAATDTAFLPNRRVTT